MKRWQQISLLNVCADPLASTSETCMADESGLRRSRSCQSVLPCYFNKHAEYPHCEFNMAVKVRKDTGQHQSAGSKYG